MSITLVTGANQGLGLALIAALAEHNSNSKLILASRNLVNGQKAAADLQKKGYTNIDTVQLDVTDDASIDKALEWIEKAHGKVDNLVLNAAISSGRTGHYRQDFEQIMDTNVTSNVIVLRKFSGVLQKASNPRVICVSSSVGSVSLAYEGRSYLPDYDGLAYPASKAALNVTMELIRHIWSREGKKFKLLLLCPGYCSTNMTSYEGYKSPDDGVKAAFKAITTDDWESGSFFSLEDDAKGFQTVPW